MSYDATSNLAWTKGENLNPDLIRAARHVLTPAVADKYFTGEVTINAAQGLAIAKELGKIQRDAKLTGDETLGRLSELVDFHRTEAKTYNARSSDCQHPTVCKWHTDMADRHTLWADDIQSILDSRAAVKEGSNRENE